MKSALRSIGCAIAMLGALVCSRACASDLIAIDGEVDGTIIGTPTASWQIVENPNAGSPRVTTVQATLTDDIDVERICGDVKFRAAARSGHVRIFVVTKGPVVVTSGGFDRIAAVPHIEELRLDGPAITDDSLKSLGGLADLRALRLSDTSVSGSGLSFLTGARELEALELGTTESSDAAIGSLKQFPKLEKLCLTAGSWGTNPTLPQLITRNGLKHLSDAPKLRCLELHGLPIDDLGTREIAALPSLRSLCLERCPLNDDSLTALTSRSRIESLSLDCDITAAEQLLPLAKLTNLKHLTVMHIGNDRRLGKNLPEILECLPNLVELDLSYAWVDDDSMAAIAAMAHLENLRLDWSAITDDGLKQIAGLKYLRLLSLSCCTKIDDKGAEYIGKLTWLRDLDLDGTGITDKGIAYLASLTELKRLHLPSKITDAGIRHLTGMQKLENLDSYSSRVTAAGLKYLHDHCPALNPDGEIAGSKNYMKDGVLHVVRP